MQASPARGPDSMDVIDLGDGRSLRGFIDSGYGPVVDAFKANYLLRDDLGSARSAYVGGRRVVELWGGIADRRTGRAWNRDTSAVVFSCSKGVLAVCVDRLVEEGRVDPDAPIAWGTGVQLSSPPGPPMLGPASFGHAGAGGQLGFADASREVGFASVSNQMGGYGDARARELTLALGRVVGA